MQFSTWKRKLLDTVKALNFVNKKIDIVKAKLVVWIIQHGHVPRFSDHSITNKIPELLGILLDFSAVFPAFFRKNHWIFPQTLQCSQEYLKSFPIRRFVRRTENCPILKTFLTFITGRRFGGVGAAEGRKKRA